MTDDTLGARSSSQLRAKLPPLVSLLPGAACLPYVRLGVWPTPVGRLEATSAVVGADVFVKRDDVSANAYGGNKVRKLEFLLGQVVAERRRTVVTFGAVGSNHVLATAVHGARLGLEVHAVLAPQPPTPNLSSNLLGDIGAGAILHPVASFEEAQAEGALGARELTERDGVEPMVIPFGGTSTVGTLGFVSAALELAGQADRGELPIPDLVYVPLGSMGTAVGLAIGFALAGLPTQVVGVRVVPEQVAGVPQAIQLATAVVELLRSVDRHVPALEAAQIALEVRDGFFGQGYAVPTDAGSAAVEAAAVDGLHLEGTYTGKAMAALLEDGHAGRLAGRRVLFWNTYNSRPLPAPGEVAQLPGPLQGYVMGE